MDCSISNISLEWKSYVGGGGEYTPIVADYKVFIHTWNGKVYALDMENGEILWERNIRRHKVFQSPWWGHTLISSPAYSEGRLFVGSDDGWVYCLDAENGDILWEKQIGFSLMGCYGSVTLKGDKVFIGNGDSWFWGSKSLPGFLYALDINTGRVIWKKFFIGGGVGNAPAVDNGMVFVSTLDHNIYAFNASNGELIWRYQLLGQSWCSPSVSNGKVFIGDMSGRVYALREEDGELLWMFKAGEWLCCSTPTIHNGRVYFGVYLGDRYPYGALYCLDESTGEELWCFKHSHICPPPVIGDNIVFFGSHDGYFYGLNGETGEIIWKYRTRGVAQTEGAIVGNHLFLGSNDGWIYCFNLS